MITTHYEVYVQDRARAWALHARFPSEQREAAVEEAKDMERSGFRVRVSRETYDTEENSYEDTDIYLTRGKSPADAASGPARSPAAGGGGAAKAGGGGAVRKSGDASPRPAKAAQKKAFDAKQAALEATEAARSILHSKAFMYIVVLTLLGVTAGGAMVYALPRLLTWAWNHGIPITLTADGYDTMMVAAFGGAFLLVTVPLGISFLPKMTRSDADQDESPEQARARQATAQRETRLRESLDSLSRSALIEENAAAKAKPSETGPTETGPTEKGPTEADDQPDTAGQAPKIAAPPPEDEPPPPSLEAEKSSAPSAETEKDVGPESTAKAEAGNKLRKFVDSAIAAVRTTNTQLDSYNKFALHLYVAGAVDSLADAKSLMAPDRRRLTAEALAAIGTTGAMADQFHDKLREYTVEERYARMVGMGREAMSDYMKGAEGSAHGQLTGAIQEWSRGSQAAKPAGLVTLMFTDMVGSTDMTQDRGDEAAQEIVRRHNTIVRMALSQFGGREIKHTGDGIMASFDDATGAIDATISIQRNVANHNRARPDQPLHLRIGLNAGKPIREENDMFGATVQLAARVCAATQSDQTLCTESVRDCSRDRSAVLKPVGAHSLKGFKDPVPLLEISW